MADAGPGSGRPGLPLRILRGSLLASGPAAALLFYGVAGWPDAVERVYGRSLYPAFDRCLARLTAWCSWSLGELLLFALAAWALVSAAQAATGFRQGRKEGLRRLRAWGLGAAAALSLLYAAFVLAWGLNYRRPPLASRLAWPVAPASAAELGALCSELAVQVNGLRRACAPDEAPASVRNRAAEGYQRLGAALAPAVPDLRPAHPKFALLSALMSRALTHGMVVPWTHEALVNRETPPASLPFALCHEMAHQRGVAREDEANFVGYLAARLHPDPGYRYSALRFALAESLGKLAQADPGAAARVVEGLDPAVREDYRRDAAWSRRNRSRFSEIQGRAYDRYLKAQGQREGVRSYGRVVDLLLAERRMRAAGALPAALR
ncbi:MAG: DUF3810 domain-containing protein [Holophagaceae bacterium]